VGAATVLVRASSGPNTVTEDVVQAQSPSGRELAVQELVADEAEPAADHWSLATWVSPW
jgi:hypothetical protein